jgi:hypothetical protein
MTVTGRFLADFSDFTSAVQGAVADLGGLEDKAGDTARAMSDLGDPAAVKETTAATKELTGATVNAGDAFAGLGKYIAGAFTIGAVTAFAASVIDLAGDIARLSEATGLTADEVQRLLAVSNATSVPLETLTKASTNLSLAVGSRDAGLLGALRELGISFDEFARLTPGAQFDMLATAIGGVEDHTDRLRLAQEAMGKAGVQAIGALRTDTAALGDATVKMSDDAIAGLNRLDAAWKNLKTSVKAIAGNITQELATAQTDAGRQPNAQGFAEAAAALKAVYEGLEFPKMAGSVIGAYRDSLLSVMPGLGQITVAEQELTDILAEQDRQFKSNQEAQEAAAAAAAAQAAALKKFGEAMIELNGIGATYQATLEGIDGETVEGVKYYLEAGVAQGTLATAYGLTATQIRAVATALGEETKERAKTAAAQAQFADAMAALNGAGVTWQQTLDTINGEVVEAVSYYLDLGVAQGTLATAYGLTTTQVNAIATAHRASTDALAAEKKSILETVDAMADESEMAKYLTQYYKELDAVRNPPARPSALSGPGGMGSGNVIGGALFPTAESLAGVGMIPGSFFGLSTQPVTTGNVGRDYLQEWRDRQAAFGRQFFNDLQPGGVNMAAGAVQINYPIMNDPTALNELGRIVGDAVMSRVTRTGATV